MKNKIKVGNYVKCYNLCTGEIIISQINNVFDKNVGISTWRGNDEFRYNGSKKFKKIPPYTAIYDKSYRGWVFRLNRLEACFSTKIVDASCILIPLLVSNEKVTYDFDNDLFIN